MTEALGAAAREAVATVRGVGRAAGEKAVADDLFALCRPARLFSGDVWLWRRERDGLRFALADVAGKGIGAVVYTAMIAEELGRRLSSPSRLHLVGLANELNTVLHREMPANRFASLVVGHLDNHGILRLLSAGHCPALVRREDGTIEIVEPTGPVLGVFPEPRFDERRLRLAHGEPLVLFTDGVLEAPSPSGQELGLEGVAQALVSAPPSGAAATAAVLLDRLEAHLGGASATDDVSILVVTGTGGSSSHSPSAGRPRKHLPPSPGNPDLIYQ